MSQNPILNSSRSLNLYLLFWLLVCAVYFSLLYFGLHGNFKLAITDSLVFNILFCGIGLSFWYPVRFMSVETNLVKIVINHLTAAVLATAVWLLAGYLFITLVLNFGENFSTSFETTLIWRILLGILLNLLVTAFYYIII